MQYCYGISVFTVLLTERGLDRPSTISCLYDVYTHYVGERVCISSCVHNSVEFWTWSDTYSRLSCLFWLRVLVLGACTRTYSCSYWYVTTAVARRQLVCSRRQGSGRQAHREAYRFTNRLTALLSSKQQGTDHTMIGVCFEVTLSFHLCLHMFPNWAAAELLQSNLLYCEDHSW